MAELNKDSKHGNNLLNRGKTEKDNELILKSMNVEAKVTLPRIELDNGIIYDGEWLKAMREGEGKQTWADNSVYIGLWKNNQANGNGILEHSDGDRYEGEWVNDKACGHGIYTHSNGAKYEG